jgi:hypothetical protein
VNSSGTVYLTDTGNNRVLKLPVGETTHQSGHIPVTDPVEEAETGLSRLTCRLRPESTRCYRWAPMKYGSG